MNTIRIVLVDDHPLVREGLKGLLSAHADMAIVGEAANGGEALERAEALAPDVMILDVTMPELNGIETMKQIRARSLETEVIALSMHASDQVVTDMLRAGASGYMLKTASVAELPLAIRTVMKGETFLTHEIADAVPPELLRGRTPNRSQPVSESRELSAREREVLKLVAEGRSSREIAEALYVTTKTIVFHRQSIMDKLDLRSVAELTKYAVRMGLTAL